MNEANLTRFGPEVYELVQGQPTTHSASFRAVDGPAKLVLQDDGIDNAWIKINGESVNAREWLSGLPEGRLPGAGSHSWQQARSAFYQLAQQGVHR